jgi:tight adherence protein B
MLAAIAILLFLIIALTVFAVFAAFDQRNAHARLLRERLSAIDQAQTRAPSEELAMLRDDLLSGIPALNRLLAKSQRVSRLQRLLMQAEVDVRAGKFLLLVLVTALMGALFGVLFSQSALISAAAAAAGAWVPFQWVLFRRARRFKKFEEKFPEAIDLLARAVRAGHAFSTALELIATELGEPVSGEFRKLFEEQKFGLPMRDALLNLAERMPLIDVKFFVTTVTLQRESGGNLAEILDKLSYVIRERFKILRQVRVFTAQGRLTMMLLMALPPGVMALLTLVNRDFVWPLFTDPIGHTLLVTGATLQFIGYLLIRRIIHIQV